MNGEWVMPNVEELGEWAASFWEAINEGFIVGLALGGVLPLGLIFLFWLIARRRHKCHGIHLQNENGELYVTVTAIREFITRITDEFAEAALRGVELRRRQGRQIIRVVIDAVPGTDLVALQQRLSQRVLDESSRKIGIDAAESRVHVIVQKYSAKAERAARRKQRGKEEQPVVIPADAESAGEEPEAEPVPVERDPIPVADEGSTEEEKEGREKKAEGDKA